MTISHTSFTRTGQRRSNQDAIKSIIDKESGKALFIVCDGMGGHAMGEVASLTVCEAVAAYWTDHIHEPDTEEKYMKACEEAMKAVNERADRLNHVEMGTTMVLAAIDNGTLTVVHCGDSRCYLLRKGEVAHQTRDHSNPDVGWDVVSRCFFSYCPEVAQPDITRIDLEDGDRIFLCSDGVYKGTAPEILTARLMDDKPLEEITDTIEFLCEKNSDDNYSGILAEIRQ